MRRQYLLWRFYARALISREPGLAFLYLPVVLWTQYRMRGKIDPRECRVGSDTELLIDGFPGSGNSFATGAFKRSQTRPVRLAHHLHSPAQIIKAVRLRIPTLVTLREPGDAAVSLTSRWPYVSVRMALELYIGFYEKIAPYSHGFILSPFDRTTKRVDEVFREVNARFDRNFAVFEYNDANMSKLRPPDLLRSDKARRQAIKAEKAMELRGNHEHALRRAEAVYERLLPYTRMRQVAEPADAEAKPTASRGR